MHGRGAALKIEHRKTGLPLQAWVALLVATVTLPLGALVFWNAQQTAREAEDAARRDVSNIARQVAAETGAFIDDTRGILQRTATRPDILHHDGRCSVLFASFRDFFPRYANLLLVDGQGRGVCANIAMVPGEGAYSGFPWFTSAMEGADFVIDKPRLGRTSKRWISVVVTPVRDAERRPVGVLALAIDLHNFPIPLLRSSGLPANAVVGIVDGEGVVVARSQGQERIGAPALPVVREMQRTRASGALPVRDERGGHHLAAIAPVPGTTWDAVVLYPADDAVAGVQQARTRTLGIGLLVLVAVWALAALAAQRLLRPVRQLDAAVTAFGRGGHDAQVVPGGPREIARIGESFNAMAERRKRDEAALRESEARYRSLFETSADAIVGIDAESRIVFANPAVEKLSGWRPLELVGHDLAVLQPASLRESHRPAMAAGGPASRASPATVETRLLHRDGREVPIEVRLSRVELGDELLVVGLMRDISERQAALASLRESEERFRAMADSTPVLVWTADDNGRCTYVNATWLAFAGRSLDDATALGWLDGVHAEDAAAVADHWQDGYARRVGGTLEYRRRRHDGAWRWLLDVRAPRFSGDGRFLGFVGSAVDIHARVEAEGRIRRLTALYAVLSQANEAIARGGDLDTLLQNVCDVVVRETALSGAAVALAHEQGRRLRTVAAAGPVSGFLATLDVALGPEADGRERPGSLALRTGQPVISNRRREDVRVAPLDIEPLREQIQATAVFPLHQGSAPSGVLALYAAVPDYFDDELVRLLALLAEDLSFALESHAARLRRDTAEAELRRLNVDLEQRVAERTRSLEAANREMEAFTYSVSHDLRAPLRGISGFAELVQESAAGRLDDSERAYLDRVKAAAARMGRLIDDLLSLSRITRQAMRREPVDLTRIAGEIVEELRNAHPGRQVDVAIEPGLAANADPGLARILVDNLLGNAWKFTSRTPGARVAFMRATLDGGPAFAIRDNGAGFDPAYADKLFTPFQRLHTEREFPGSGIGLAIVQRIVNRHGGRVAAQSTPGQGAAFTFAFEGPGGHDGSR